MLNRYFEPPPAAILDEGGTVVQFVGDALMALFNAPARQHDHAVRAARAALRMQAAVEATAAAEPDWPRFRVGHQHRARAGRQHRQHRAAQLQRDGRRGERGGPAGVARPQPGQVVIGESTRVAAARRGAVESLGELAVKGRRSAVVAYRLFGLHGAPRPECVVLPVRTGRTACSARPFPRTLRSMSRSNDVPPPCDRPCAGLCPPRASPRPTARTGRGCSRGPGPPRRPRGRGGRGAGDVPAGVVGVPHVRPVGGPDARDLARHDRAQRRGRHAARPVRAAAAGARERRRHGPRDAGAGVDGAVDTALQRMVLLDALSQVSPEHRGVVLLRRGARPSLRRRRRRTRHPGGHGQEPRAPRPARHAPQPGPPSLDRPIPTSTVSTGPVSTAQSRPDRSRSNRAGSLTVLFSNGQHMPVHQEET